MFGYTSSSAPQLADTKVKRASREIAALMHVVRPVPGSGAARHDARCTSAATPASAAARQRKAFSAKTLCDWNAFGEESNLTASDSR